jgi:hypothetical protein
MVSALWMRQGGHKKSYDKFKAFTFKKASLLQKVKSFLVKRM